MSSAPPGDSRLEAGSERDVRPVVDRPRGGLSTTALVALALVVGLVLFGVLNARRQAASAPAIRDTSRDAALVASPPPLYLPPAAPDMPLAPAPPALPIAPVQPVVPAPQPVARTPQVAYQASAPAPQLQTTPAPRSSAGSAVVVDTSQTATPANDRSNNNDNPLAAPSSTNRAHAGFLANKATTVPQGTLIPAVLETAFDSTRPGFARALVQRDIRGFDGTQVLIPRGSRLIGEYAADTAQGQNRAMIAWSRLIRPDGVTIAIGSPVADPVGRGGVKAQVNSHFLTRFAGAILQSTLDVGVNLASRSTGSPTIVALPGSIQGANLIQTPTAIRPTLRVAQGTSVSVFVARDLDFTDTDGTR